MPRCNSVRQRASAPQYLPCPCETAIQRERGRQTDHCPLILQSSLISPKSTRHSMPHLLLNPISLLLWLFGVPFSPTHIVFCSTIHLSIHPSSSYQLSERQTNRQIDRQLRGMAFRRPYCSSFVFAPSTAKPLLCSPVGLAELFLLASSEWPQLRWV